MQRVPVTKLCQLGLPGDNVAPGWCVVAHHGPVGGVVLPVGRCHLQELDWIRLDVDT